MATLHRVIDANANRAREALRVLEDAARFHLDDAPATEAIKALRHELLSALRRLPPGVLDASRNVEGDVGTRISHASEMTRQSYADVVAAAGSRLGESLRSIEEAAKVLDSSLAGAVEQIRYRAYAAQQRLAQRLNGGRSRQWRVCVLLSESICRRPWLEVARLALAAGADCIQIREKTLDGGLLRTRVRRVLDLASEYGASVIVNDRVDVAMAAGAHGVHLGQDDLAIADARRIAGASLLVGASTHTMQEAATAVEGGCDYCGVGAMFPTALKPDRTPAGIEYLRAFIARYPSTPHLAIGGITADNVGALVEAGCQGAAVSTAVCAAHDPDEVVRRLRAAFERVVVVPTTGAGVAS
jgi:thiamine-phosphate pyrophosphorylase